MTTYGRHSKGRRDQPPSPPPEMRGIETFRRLDDAQPKRHGAGGDPRYPSPRKLRRISSFAVDLLLHACPMIVIFAAIAHDPSLPGEFHKLPLLAFLSWPLLSLADRVLVQSIFHATTGKAIFGLVTIRPEDGGWPTFGRLAKAWFVGLVISIALAASILGDFAGGGPDLDTLPSTVRRRDVLARQQDLGQAGSKAS